MFNPKKKEKKTMRKKTYHLQLHKVLSKSVSNYICFWEKKAKMYTIHLIIKYKSSIHIYC